MSAPKIRTLIADARAEKITRGMAITETFISLALANLSPSQLEKINTALDEKNMQLQDNDLALMAKITRSVS